MFSFLKLIGKLVLIIRDDGKVKNKREEDDLPPSASIYDFTRSPYTKDAPRCTIPLLLEPSLFLLSVISIILISSAITTTRYFSITI